MVFKFSISFLLWQRLFSEKSTPLANIVRQCCLSFDWTRNIILWPYPEGNVQIYRGFWISSFLLSWTNWRKWFEEKTRWRSSEELDVFMDTRTHLRSFHIQLDKEAFRDARSENSTSSVSLAFWDSSNDNSQLFFYIQKIFSYEVGHVFKWCFNF